MPNNLKNAVPCVDVNTGCVITPHYTLETRLLTPLEDPSPPCRAAGSAAARSAGASGACATGRARRGTRAACAAAATRARCSGSGTLPVRCRDLPRTPRQKILRLEDSKKCRYTGQLPILKFIGQISSNGDSMETRLVVQGHIDGKRAKAV